MKQIEIMEDAEDVSESLNVNEDCSTADLRNKEKHTSFTFHGNPKKFASFVNNQLGDMGYQIPNMGIVRTLSGGEIEDRSDITVRICAVKRTDIKGKIKRIIPKSVIKLIACGAIPTALSIGIHQFYSINPLYTIVPAIITAFGGFLAFKGPKQKILSYHPSNNVIWVVAEGEAILGSKTQNIKDGGTAKTIQTSHLTSDMEVNIASETQTMDELYREKLLKDEDKTSPSFFTIIKALINKKKEITMENEEAYNSLHDSKEAKMKHTSQELEDIANKLNKFTGVN